MNEQTNTNPATVTVTRTARELRKGDRVKLSDNTYGERFWTITTDVAVNESGPFPFASFNASLNDHTDKHVSGRPSHVYTVLATRP